MAKKDNIKHKTNIKFDIGLITTLSILYLGNHVEGTWLVDYLACSGTRRFVKFMIG